MDAALRAGAAIYNAGHYHAAHDAWEDRWLGLDSGTEDERLLHGLIQFSAVLHHGHAGNWSGAQGLAESAGTYLADLPADYRGVDLDEIRPYLAAVAADPETVERRAVPPLRIDGEAPRLDGLDFAAAAVAAEVLAETIDGYDAETVARAVEYAREERNDDTGTRTRFITLILDFTGNARQRALVYQRLSQHVERRRRRETDVAGLFE